MWGLEFLEYVSDYCFRIQFFCLQLEASCLQWSFLPYSCVSELFWLQFELFTYNSSFIAYPPLLNYYVINSEKLL